MKQNTSDGFSWDNFRDRNGVNKAANDLFTGSLSGVSKPEFFGKYPPSLPQALTQTRAN